VGSTLAPAKLKADRAAHLEAELVVDRWNRRLATGKIWLVRYGRSPTQRLAHARCRLDGGRNYADREVLNSRCPASGSSAIVFVSDDCPGIAWKPVKTRGQIGRASTLREVIRERREVIVRQARIGMA
jgi:hypothetical protein